MLMMKVRKSFTIDELKKMNRICDGLDKTNRLVMEGKSDMTANSDADPMPLLCPVSNVLS